MCLSVTQTKGDRRTWGYDKWQKNCEERNFALPEPRWIRTPSALAFRPLDIPPQRRYSWGAKLDNAHDED
jgi:hypothetical protein